MAVHSWASLVQIWHLQQGMALMSDQTYTSDKLASRNMHSEWCCIGTTYSAIWSAVLKLRKGTVGAWLRICEQMIQMYSKEIKRKEKSPAPCTVGTVRTLGTVRAADDAADELLLNEGVLKEGVLKERAALLAEEDEEDDEPPLKPASILPPGEEGRKGCDLMGERNTQRKLHMRLAQQDPRRSGPPVKI